MEQILDFSRVDFLTGAVQVILEGPLNKEVASYAVNDEVANRVTPLAESVLVSNLTEDEVANLRGRGFEILQSGDLSVVSMPIEMAAGKAKTKKKVNDSKRALAESAKLKHMRDKGALNIVKKLFNQYVGAEDDYTLFVSFFRDFDNLIDEYCTLHGDHAQETEVEDDEDEADDVDETDTVASAEETSVDDQLAAIAALEEEVASAEQEDKRTRLSADEMQDTVDTAVVQQ